ncbi:MAG: polyprenyl synthetase family protein [Fibrobacterales bacterium]
MSKARELVHHLIERSDTEINTIAENAPGKLKDRLCSVVARKGKRIRSTLLYLFATSNGGAIDEKATAKSAASIELLHLASLIHDDVIDVSETRRGDKTAHTKWGNHMAVLVGDYTLAQSLSLVVQNDNNHIAALISQTAGELVAGEILEIDNQGNNDLSIEEYNRIIYGKTASLLEVSAEIGAIHAGYPAETVAQIRKVGNLFGMAFQVVDDLLDFGVGATELGKKPFTDISNDVMSLPIILFLSKASIEEKESFKALALTTSEQGTIPKILELLNKHSVFRECQTIALNYLNEATEILKGLPASQSRELLIEMCEAMSYRCN